MERDLKDKLVATATFDRVIDAGEGMEIARMIETHFQRSDPDARMLETWLDIDADQTTLYVTFASTDRLREAWNPIPEEEWPADGEAMSFTVRDDGGVVH